MKNLLPVILGLVMMAPTAKAADATDFKWSAELRPRYMTSENSDFLTKNNQNAFFQRTKLGVTAIHGENLSAHISFMHSSQWGKHANVSTVEKASASDPNDLAVVQEAWGWWKVNENVSMRIGRSSYQIADGTVVSYNDWSQNPYTFEGAGAMFDYDFAKIAVFGVKALEFSGSAASSTTSFGASNGITDPEIVFYGISFDFKNLPDVLKMANIHVMQKNVDEHTTVTTTATAPAGGGAVTNTTTTTAAAGANQLRYGIALGGDTNGFDYKLDYAANTGKDKTTGGTPENITENGSMYDITLGYRMAEMMNWRLGVNYHVDSGDTNSTDDKNEKYDSFFYDQHGHGGLMDLVAWGNLTYTQVKFTIEPVENTELGLLYTMFSRTTDKDTVSTTGGATLGNANDKKDIGNEVDIYANHKYNDNFSILAQYGIFTPGDLIKKNAGGNEISGIGNYTAFLVQGKMTF